MKRTARYCLFVALALITGASCATLPVFAASERHAKFDPKNIIIKLRGDDMFRVVKYPVAIDVYKEIVALKKHFDLDYAEPDFIATAFFVPNDPQYRLQWNFDNAVSGGIDTTEAWDVSQGEGIVVAVIDTGIAYENYESGKGKSAVKYMLAPDLVQTMFVSGYDFVGGDTHANDDNGHGTHVAGTIAGSTNNKLGVAGIAYKAKLMPIKVLDKTGEGTYSNIAKGIRFAADNGARIINLSLGGPADSTALKEAIEYAASRNVTIVAAAGNDGEAFISYPAAYGAAIAVGATRFDLARASYSSFGAPLDLVAPGGDLRADQNDDGYNDGILQQTFQKNLNRFGYYFYQGTSMASAHVSGVAALIASHHATTSPAFIREALEKTAEDLGAPGTDPEYGNGLINALRALQY